VCLAYTRQEEFFLDFSILEDERTTFLRNVGKDIAEDLKPQHRAAIQTSKYECPMPGD
jgi:hypothetical protein